MKMIDYYYVMIGDDALRLWEDIWHRFYVTTVLINRTLFDESLYQVIFC